MDIGAVEIIAKFTNFHNDYVFYYTSLAGIITKARVSYSG